MKHSHVKRGSESRGGCESEGVRRPQSAINYRSGPGKVSRRARGWRTESRDKDLRREIYHFILMRKQKEWLAFHGERTDGASVTLLSLSEGYLFRLTGGGGEMLQVFGSQPGERVFSAQ